MDPVIRCYAALYLSYSAPKCVKQCRAITAKMASLPIFANAMPTYAQVKGDIDALDTAEQATHQGTVGDTSERNAKFRIVRSDMRQLKGFVQGVADLDPANAETIILSSGMSVAKTPVRVKAGLSVRHGLVPTTVDVFAKASKRRAAYHWQMSSNGQTWIDLPETITARTSVSGLTPATVYYFRMRTLTAEGFSHWSPPVSIIAH